MHKLTHRIALIAFAGTMLAGGPAFAAPPNGPSSQQPPDFCTQNPTAPECLPGADNGKSRHKGNHDNNGGQNNSGGQNNDGQGGDQHHGGQPPTPGGNAPPPPDNNNDNHPPQHGNQPPPPKGSQPPPPDNRPPPKGFNWSQHDRDNFDRQFGGFNFGIFGVPGFSIHLGVTVPHSYGLKPVPRAIYRQYPQFRGYLFFTTRHGDVVIVSPKSHRIVAIL